MSQGYIAVTNPVYPSISLEKKCYQKRSLTMLCGYATLQMSRLWTTSVSLFIHAVWKTQQQNMSCILSPVQLVAVTRGFDISLRRNPTRLPICIKSKWALIILQFKIKKPFFFTTEVNTYFNLFIKARESHVLPLYTLHTVFDILFVMLHLFCRDSCVVS